MASLAQRHRARTLGKIAASGARTALGAARPPEGASEYEHQRAAMGEDLRRLKNIQSVEAKVALKRELIAAYDPWVEGVMSAARDDDGRYRRGTGTQDDILVQTMIWAIDIGDAARALPRAEYALLYDLEMPGRFNRTLACFVAEAFAEHALASEGTGDLDTLLQVEALTDDRDMPDEARAKLHKAIGEAIAAQSAPVEGETSGGPAGGRKSAIESALRHLSRAVELNKNVGAKTQIKGLERELKTLTDAGESAEE